MAAKKPKKPKKLKMPKRPKAGASLDVWKNFEKNKKAKIAENKKRESDWKKAVKSWESEKAQKKAIQQRTKG